VHVSKTESTESALSRLLARFRGPMAIYLGASILARVGSIFLIPLYTRRLSRAEYGDYSLAQAVVQILPAVLTLGLGVAIPRFFYEGDAKTSRAHAATIATWLCVLAFGGGVIAEIGVLMAGHTGSGLFARWELTCVVIASVGAAFASVPSVYLRAVERPLYASAFQIAQFVATAGFGILLVGGVGRGLTGSIEALAVANGILGIASLAFTMRELRGALDKKLLRESVVFSVPFLVHQLALWLQAAADRWTMKGIGLDAELGTYSLAATLVAPVTLFVAAFADADGPRQGEAYRAAGLDGIRARLRRTFIGYVVATIVPGVLVLAGVPVLSFVIGKNFASALYLVPFLLVAPILDALYYPSTNVVYYASRTRYVPIATLCATATNVFLNVLLIPRIGVAGAIAARVTSAGVRTAVISWAARRCLALPKASEAAR
jgi:O-antigen/teichoic acid export membrane protein